MEEIKETKYESICWECEKDIPIGSKVYMLDDTLNFSRFAVVCEICKFYEES